MGRGISLCILQNLGQEKRDLAWSPEQKDLIDVELQKDQTCSVCFNHGFLDD